MELRNLKDPRLGGSEPRRRHCRSPRHSPGQRMPAGRPHKPASVQVSLHSEGSVQAPPSGTCRTHRAALSSAFRKSAPFTVTVLHSTSPPSAAGAQGSSRRVEQNAPSAAPVTAADDATHRPPSPHTSCASTSHSSKAASPQLSPSARRAKQAAPPKPSSSRRSPETHTAPPVQPFLSAHSSPWADSTGLRPLLLSGTHTPPTQAPSGSASSAAAAHRRPPSVSHAPPGGMVATHWRRTGVAGPPRRAQWQAKPLAGHVTRSRHGSPATTGAHTPAPPGQASSAHRPPAPSTHIKSSPQAVAPTPHGSPTPDRQATPLLLYGAPRGTEERQVGAAGGSHHQWAGRPPHRHLLGRGGGRGEADEERGERCTGRRGGGRVRRGLRKSQHSRGEGGGNGGRPVYRPARWHLTCPPPTADTAAALRGAGAHPPGLRALGHPHSTPQRQAPPPSPPPRAEARGALPRRAAPPPTSASGGGEGGGRGGRTRRHWGRAVQSAPVLPTAPRRPCRGGRGQDSRGGGGAMGNGVDDRKAGGGEDP
ncbi:hypothetical protein BU14_0154s0033 [Porphyra umbilicalis]|uniref:Uncharacterized protein n=1 Tax=Porphyra umbilicalis TaxID=2786 RepID=A0A1X6P8V6_PORUM|nr:hypothetical protein BU14_0154s0033 [Porphyra umbilicalis]|eukprot:OSX77257.1 hypothetical protein BU14_0154s0033 [Porphyra umbilicalis]